MWNCGRRKTTLLWNIRSINHFRFIVIIVTTTLTGILLPLRISIHGTTTTSRSSSSTIIEGFCIRSLPQQQQQQQQLRYKSATYQIIKRHTNDYQIATLSRALYESSISALSSSSSSSSSTQSSSSSSSSSQPTQRKPSSSIRSKERSLPETEQINPIVNPIHTKRAHHHKRRPSHRGRKKLQQQRQYPPSASLPNSEVSQQQLQQQNDEPSHDNNNNNINSDTVKNSFIGINDATRIRTFHSNGGMGLPNDNESNNNNNIGAVRVESQQQQQQQQQLDCVTVPTHGSSDSSSTLSISSSSLSSTFSMPMDIQALVSVDPKSAHDAINHLWDIYSNPSNFSDITAAATTIILQQQAQLPPCDFVTCFATVMDGYIQLGKLHEAQGVLNQMERDKIFHTTTTVHHHHYQTSTTSVDQIYIRMAQAWADDSKNDYSGASAEQAESILRRVMSLYTTTADSSNNMTDTDLQPQRRELARYSRKGSNNERTTRRESNTDRTITSVATIGNTAIVKIWTIVIDAWSKRAGIVQRAVARADDILHQMETHEHSFIRPNVMTYTNVICGLSRCRHNDMSRKAEDILERMKQHNVQPDMVTYAAVMNCWAKAVSRRERDIAGNRAIRLLNEMERLYITKKVYNVKPSTLTYISVIAALGNCFDPNAAQLAEEILQRMRNLHEAGTISNVKPNTATYNAVIFALGQAPISKRHPIARRTELLLDDMTQRAELGERDVQPDVRTWAFVLRAWIRSKQPDTAENAQRVLDKMEYRFAKGMSQVRPNFVCYTTVMGAWGYSRSKNALNKMELILKRMEDRYTETLEPDVRPNTVSYVTCIDAFVGRNEPDAAQRAQTTVDRMMQLYAKGLGHVKPTRPVFDVLILAWSRSKEKNAAQLAEKIFHWMENQYNQTGDTLVRPNEVTLCAVLNAWANQAERGGAARALQIWEHITSVAATTTQGDCGFRLTVAMPNIVIKAIARSRDIDAVIKAERVLLQLEEDYRSGKSYVRPDVTTYSSVINACAYGVGNAAKRTEAFQVALRTFYKLYDMDDETANNITYGTMFKAIQNLMPISEERMELTRQLFDMCCEEGCVDYFVLSQVRFASPQLYRDLVEGPCGLGGPGLKYGLDAVLKNIPTEWTANTLE